jgi:hypothetical protein
MVIDSLARHLSQFEFDRPSRLLLPDACTVGCIAARRDVVDLERHDVATPKFAVDGYVEQSQITIRPSTWSFVRMDHTCFGRSGGFAPTIFPLFQGTCLETLSIVLKTSVMVTSSVNEGAILNLVIF